MSLPLTRTGSDTIGSLLHRRTAVAGGEPFVTFEDTGGSVRTLTYGDACMRASRIANMLQRMGVSRGDRINLHLTNCLEFLDCLFGAALIGAIVVPTNPLSTSDELAFMLEHSKCGISITQPDVVETVLAVRGSADHRQVLLARTSDPVLGTTLLQDAIAEGTDEFVGTRAEGTDIVSIMYTSGTTSRPKGVLVSNAAYLHAGHVVAEHLRLQPSDRQLVVLPLFHGNAQFYSLMSALVTGCSVALMSRFSASKWAEQAARYECTVASLFAAPIRMILAQPARPVDGINVLQTVLFAQNISENQLAEFEGRFGCQLLQLYGMTETVSPPVMNPMFGERRNIGIGRPLLWARIRVVDDDGQDVPAGATGELIVGGEPGDTLMSGYLDDPDATSRALRDGWLSTGDNVRVDVDGYLYFVDRGKDMIKRAGENVATGEIERVVNEHPAVFDSAAIGIPDPLRDESIKVFVVLRERAAATSDEIIEWCKSRLSKFKVPEYIQFVGELPRTSVGKVQKNVLREWHEASQQTLTASETGV